MIYLAHQMHRNATGLTEGDSEGFTCTDRVILQLIMHETKGEHQGMQKTPEKEEDTPATLVDHPMPPLLAETIRLIGSSDGSGSVGPLEPLQPPAFCLVPLQVASTGLDSVVVGHVGVLFYMGHLAIGKVQTGEAFRCSHCCCG